MYEFKYNYLFPIEARITHKTSKNAANIDIIEINNLDDLSKVMGTTCILCLAAFCKDLDENKGILRHEDDEVIIEFISKYYEKKKEN